MGGAAFHGMAGVSVPILLRKGDITPQLAQLAHTGPNHLSTPGLTVMTWERPHDTQFNLSRLSKFGPDASVWGLYFLPGTAALRFNFMTPSGNGSVTTAARGMNTWTLVTLTAGSAGLDVNLNGAMC